MKSIEFLEWDSGFFQKKIGKVILGNEDKFEDFQIREYDLVYVFSENDKLNYPLVDKKVVLEFESIKSSEMSFDANCANFYDSEKNQYYELLSLALQSGSFSRFNIDKNFRNNEYEKLYTAWIDKSISKELSTDILIKEIDSKIGGFLTMASKTNKVAEIGLLAVDDKLRGKGIASDLLSTAIAYAKFSGFEKMQVTTQADNIPAMNLYLKSGFKILSTTFIYHIWNYDTF